MARTVEEGFRIFHGRLTPTGGESEAARRHRESIEACLKRNLEITRFARIGSFGHGTSVRHYSDVDYLASIPRKHLKSNSSSTLRDLRDILDARFPNTGVTVRTPAVRVPFGSDASESTEIVPADFIRKDSYGRLIYDIPDRHGDWMKAAPDAHNGYVARADAALGGKVKPLIRFVKAWKYFRQVPILSFYLELEVARYAKGENTIVYSIDVKNVLVRLLDKQLASMQDPLGISGYIHPCTTDVQKQDALSKLQTAVTRARKAREAESADSISDAFYWWNLVFDNKFPAYG